MNEGGVPFGVPKLLVPVRASRFVVALTEAVGRTSKLTVRSGSLIAEMLMVFGFEEETGGCSFGGGADDDLVSRFGSKRLSENRGLTGRS